MRRSTSAADGREPVHPVAIAEIQRVATRYLCSDRANESDDTQWPMQGIIVAVSRGPAIGEACMFTPMYRCTVLFATILLASIAARPARAQDPTDLPIDFLFKGIHEWELRYNQTRLENDINRGDAAGVNRDLNRIQRDEWKLWYDRRRIRRDMWLPAGPWVPLPRSIPMGETLITHPQYPGFGYYPSNPTQLYQLPQPGTLPGSRRGSIAGAVPRRDQERRSAGSHDRLRHQWCRV